MIVLDTHAWIWLVSDPADRLIVATALTHGAVLITRDERIRELNLVKTLW